MQSHAVQHHTKANSAAIEQNRAKLHVLVLKKNPISCEQTPIFLWCTDNCRIVFILVQSCAVQHKFLFPPIVPHILIECVVHFHLMKSRPELEWCWCNTENFRNLYSLLILIFIWPWRSLPTFFRLVTFTFDPENKTIISYVFTQFWGQFLRILFVYVQELYFHGLESNTIFPLYLQDIPQALLMVCHSVSRS